MSVKPCVKCGTINRYPGGQCKTCRQIYAQENKQKERDYHMEYAQKNKVTLNAKRRDRYAKSPEMREKQRQANIRDFHRRRALSRGSGGSHTEQEWLALCEKYGNKCVYPGCNRTELTRDHIVADGPSSIDNIQPMCNQHNTSKGNRHSTDYRPDSDVDLWRQLCLLADHERHTA